MAKKAAGAQPMQSINGGAMRPYQPGAMPVSKMGAPPQGQNPMMGNPQILQLLQSMGIQQQPQPQQQPQMQGDPMMNALRGLNGGRRMGGYNPQQAQQPQGGFSGLMGSFRR